MRTSPFLPALLIAASAMAANQVTFEGVTLQGITQVTDSTALDSFGSNKSIAIGTVTDANWTTDGINSMNNGVFAATFGSTFTSAGNYIYIISPCIPPQGPSNHIGTFTASILLANGQYVSAGTFSDTSYTVTTSWVDGIYYNFTTFDVGFHQASAQYIRLDLGALDTQGIGVTGIKFANFTGSYLDLNYVGIGGTGTGGSPVPEPSTYGLMLGGLALAGAVIRRRRSKTSK